MKVPVVGDLNCEIVKTGNPVGAVGYLPIAYNVEDGSRYSSSTSYIHPILKGEWKRPNLTILTNARVNRVNIEDSRVVGVNLTLESGRKSDVRAVEETILCAGAVDTPGLLLRSGVGPRKQLEDLSIPVHADIPGVGENLQDHPEAIVVWELEKEMPPETATFCDAYLLMRREAENARGNDGQTADLYFHMFTTAWDINLRRLGYTIPKNSFSMAPNIPRPRSRGRIFLTSKDEKAAPAIDFRYFTDLEGYDEATVIAGIKACRRVASTAPFKDWIKREIAPGPQITTDEAIGEFGRRAANTLYHASCTTKMGDLKRDPFAVVDSELKVRDLKGVRIADAGVFPVITSINPMLTVLAIGERAAELIALERGWKPSDTVIDATVHGATGTTYMKT
jgi:choline dehydrogenase-like flavoprotein